MFLIVLIVMCFAFPPVGLIFLFLILNEWFKYKFIRYDPVSRERYSIFLSWVVGVVLLAIAIGAIIMDTSR